MAQRPSKEMKVEKFIRQDRPRRGTAPLPVLPPEVVQHMMSVCGSLKLVKICRLVSKSWNEISCRVLKKLSAVVIEEEDEECLEKFEQFLYERQLELPSDSPNPFQNYSVTIGPDFPANISNFIRCPKVRIVLLDLTLSPTMSADEFETLLGSCKPFLQGLSIGECCGGSKAPLSSKLTQGWPSLRALSFCDGYQSSVSTLSIKLIQALTRENPSLGKLTLRGELENIGKILETREKTDLATLRSLIVSPDKFQFTSSNSKCIESISTLDLPNLKQFEFYAQTESETLNEEIEQMILAVVGRVPHKLESLKTNFLSLQQTSPFCNLDMLACSFHEDDKFEMVNADTFPRLTHLTVLPMLTEIPDFEDAWGRKPNVLVSSLGVIYVNKYANSGTAAIWSILGRHFPAVTQISVSFCSVNQGFYNGILRAIGKWFPQLQSLELSSDTETNVLEITNLELFTQKGWPLQEIHNRNDLILDFKKLVTLKLSDSVGLDRDFIKFGLSQMKSLRSLSFPWDEASYSSSYIPEYLVSLTNLKSIVITCQSRTLLKELTKLAEATPHLSIEMQHYDSNTWKYQPI